ncbi:MAG: hypothetical protein H6834_01410 [Planctomycetes bacterium]|nr:hypothetical protein [Planctomycetota bacterium]
MSKLATALLACSLASAVSAQMNEQTFYNASRFAETTATRATTSSIDQIYFTQPVDFRRGNGRAIGWRVVLQDQNEATAEAIRLSYHGLDFQSIVPNKTEVVGANFTAFGSGSGGAKSYIYTFTLASGAAVPEFSALGLRMPAPISWPTDAMTIHFQRGDRTQVSEPKRQAWTYKLDNTNTVMPEWRDGSTFRFGGLYRVPVMQAFNGSNAYGGSLEDLLGPESIQFETGGARSDTLGLRGDGGTKFRTLGDQLGVAAIFFSADYRGTPLALNPFGNLLIDENTATFLAYMLLDSQGIGRTLTVVIPPNLGNLKLAWQGFFVAIDTNLNQLNDFELSSACRTIFP